MIISLLAQQPRSREHPQFEERTFAFEIANRKLWLCAGDSDDSYSDAENPYVPKTKKPRMEKNSDIILQSTPKKRGRGRPKNAKNKKVSGANKKGIGHKIQKKTNFI